MGNNQTVLVAEPVTGSQTVFMAEFCAIQTCALSMNGESTLRSGCSFKQMIVCLDIEGMACVCPVSENPCVVCQETKVHLIKPPILNGGALCKSNGRCLCLASRCAFPCDGEVPCMLALCFVKCCEGHPGPLKVDLRFRATIAQASGGAPCVDHMER